ncbi:hypothetical protein [Subtercola frigoramans]|uniref:Uncharacterized protein n=1 Tax=Subtercola frigoramans TaxID=120298 RepID=A0ABS2L8N5_9MICO|nr:hypothetical protein [Subtercola frigoramans]MBM7473379.1 hypothetical protein [Subtercola frigoramans]
MANKRRRKLVELPELVERGPILVKTVDDIDGVKRIAELQQTFGDNIRARIVPGVIGGRKVLHVVLRYTSYRAVAGELDDRLTKDIGRRVRWLALWNRVPSCDALIDTDPDSPNHLNVWLNPAREGNVRHPSEAVNN